MMKPSSQIMRSVSMEGEIFGQRWPRAGVSELWPMGQIRSTTWFAQVHHKLRMVSIYFIG